MSVSNIEFPFQQAFEHFLINPQTHWDRFFNPQFFISMNPGDADIENQILARVGSYGKQLGEMMAVLNALVARLPRDLTPEEQAAVVKFKKLSEDIDATKAKFRGSSENKPITLTETERFIKEVQVLAQTDPAAHRQVVERLQKVVNGNKAAQATARAH